MRSPRFFAQLADSYRQEGDLDGAIELLVKGLERSPDYITARIILARCYTDRGDDEWALEEYDRILDLDPFHTTAMKEKVKLLLRMGKVEPARRCAEMYLDEVPNDEEVRSLIDEAGEPSGAETAPAPDGRISGEEEAAAAMEISGEEAAGEPVEAGGIVREEDLTRGDEEEEERTGEEQSAAPADSVDGEREEGEVVDEEIPGEEEISGDVRDSHGERIEPDPVEDVPGSPIERATSIESENEVIATMTLAEIYASQGFYDKAIEIYQRIVTREPNNEAARIRIRELQSGGAEAEGDEESALQSSPGGDAGALGSGAAGEIVTDEEYQKFKKWLRALTRQRDDRNTPGSGEEHEFGDDS